MLNAIVTLSCDDDSFGSLRRFVADAEAFAVLDGVKLIDGGYACVSDGLPGVGETLGDVKRYVAARENLMDDAELLDGGLVALDLPVDLVSEIACGSHVGSLPANVIVQVHPACRDC